MSQSKDSGLRHRKLPKIPTFRSDVSDEIGKFSLVRRRHTQGELYSLNNNNSPRHVSVITKEIVERIKAAETDPTLQQVEMDSVRQDATLGFRGRDVGLIERASQRIAGILDIFQDEQGFWVRKIEITKVPGQGLGFFIKKGNGFDRKNGVFISRVSLGSILDVYGLLHTGDEVLEVNRVNLRGFPLEDVALMMQIPDKLLLTTKSRVPVNGRQKSPRNHEKVQAKKAQKAKHHEKLVKQNSSPGDKSDFKSKEREIIRGDDRMMKSFTNSPNRLEGPREKERSNSYSPKDRPTDGRLKTAGNDEMQRASKQITPQNVAPFKFPESPDSGIDSISGNRSVQQASPRSTKSPRKLPTPPPVGGRETSNGTSMEQTIGDNNNAQRSPMPGPQSVGFKRAELYRVQSFDQGEDQATESNNVPVFKVENADDHLTIMGNKAERRTTSATEPIKSPPKLGLFRAFSATPRGDRSDVKAEPERIYEVYESDDLNSEMQFTRAFSGMLSVHVDRLQRTQQRLAKSEFYCTLEIDDEFKASTIKKRYVPEKGIISFDEQFDIEISHASELTIYIFEVGPENQHSLSASGVVFLEKVLSTSMSRSIALGLEGPGVINASLDFTEAVKYLKRTPSNRKRGVFGFNIVSTLDDEQNTIPKIVRKCVNEIEKRGMNIVGIYRVSGNAKKKRLLKAEFDRDSNAVDVSEESGVDCNVLTGIIKDYLRELPEALIPETALKIIREAKDSEVSPNMNKRQNILCELLRKLPYGSRATLIYIMDHLIRIQEKRDVNKMDMTNLSVCFGPVLMCPPSTQVVLDFKKIIEALEYLLNIWPKHHERGVEIEITNM